MSSVPETTKPPFDREVPLGANVACMYDVDLRDIEGAAEAERIVRETRERVRVGRSVRPDASHYVNLLMARPLAEDVRAAMFPALGSDDGIDSVAVEDRTPGIANDEFAKAFSPRER